jgi:hypothetical protein
MYWTTAKAYSDCILTYFSHLSFLICNCKDLSPPLFLFYDLLLFVFLWFLMKVLLKKTNKITNDSLQVLSILLAIRLA